jgi:hypothetical protein
MAGLTAAGDPNDPAKRVNAEAPGAVSGGTIESVKRAVMVAVKETLQGTTLDAASSSAIAVEMEYPMIPEHYPGIWVQFSFTEFMNAGLSHELITSTIVNEGQPDEYTNWELIREFQFKGTITLTIMALTNLERDRLSDAVVTMLMFSRPPEYVLTDATRDTKQFRGLVASLANNPFVSMTLNHDTFTPGGQGMTPGVPWDPELPGYEDSYSFSILGQSNIVFRNDGTYTLRAVNTVEDLEPPPTPFDWQ